MEKMGHVVHCVEHLRDKAVTQQFDTSSSIDVAMKGELSSRVVQNFGKRRTFLALELPPALSASLAPSFADSLYERVAALIAEAQNTADGEKIKIPRTVHWLSSRPVPGDGDDNGDDDDDDDDENEDDAHGTFLSHEISYIPPFLF